MLLNQMWNLFYSETIAFYCFETWAIHRRNMPLGVEKFLINSELFIRNLQTRVKFLFLILTETIGNEWAVAIRQL